MNSPIRKMWLPTSSAVSRSLSITTTIGEKHLSTSALQFYEGPPISETLEEERRSILVSTAHLQEDLELSASDREAAEAVAEGLRDAKAANTRRVSAAPGTISVCGPSKVAVNHYRQTPGQSPSTWATWRPTARPWPPSPWPVLQSPTSMPPRGPPRAITPPVIRSWPRWSRVGGTRPQRPGRQAR